MAVAAQQPSPAAPNPAWVPIVTSGLSMERGRPTFGVRLHFANSGRRARFGILNFCDVHLCGFLISGLGLGLARVALVCAGELCDRLV